MYIFGRTKFSIQFSCFFDLFRFFYFEVEAEAPSIFISMLPSLSLEASSLSLSSFPDLSSPLPSPLAGSR